ncbi:MAG: NAC family transcription factor [Methanomicrobiales archaeon]|nr:NAC family transcription factor [Methanomicrobiales archaeon]
MAGDGKDGYYCTICGGIPPDQIKIKKIPIDGKETGIDRLDWILQDVLALDLVDEDKITDEIIKRVRQFNFIPTKKMPEYREALLREYRMLATGGRIGKKD